MSDKTLLIEMCVLLARETKATPYAIRELSRMAARWNTLVTHQCNRDLSAREETAKENLRAKFVEWGTQWGAKEIVLSCDPRGCTVKVATHSGVSNDWGKEGICIL